MEKLYIGLAGLAGLIGIAVLIFLLLRKKRKSNGGLCTSGVVGPVGSPCNWSDQQKQDIVTMLTTQEGTIPLGPSLNTCIVNQLSARYSYSTVKDPKFNPTDDQIREVYSRCLGVKGNWTNDFKALVASDLSSIIPPKCVSCSISAFEKAYDPVDYIDLSAKNPPPSPDPLQELVSVNCSSECR